MSMASPVPAKSQALHNFSLPLLNWSTKNNHHSKNHHRSRRLPDSSSPPLDSAARRSPLLDSARRMSPSVRDSASESELGYASENRKQPPPPPDQITEKWEKSAAASDRDREIKEARSKICIRFRKSNADDAQEEEKTGTEGEEAEESLAKTWNLRPRKPIRKQSSTNGCSPNKVESKSQSPQTTPNRSTVLEPDAAERKEKKLKFSISLSKHEIEEDIYALTGSKPARRPKKRPRTVQKQLDNLFPGLWLYSITPDCYKVYEAPQKA